MLWRTRGGAGALAWQVAMSVDEGHYFMPLAHFAGAPWGYWDTVELNDIGTGQPVTHTTMRLYGSHVDGCCFFMDLASGCNAVSVDQVMNDQSIWILSYGHRATFEWKSGADTATVQPVWKEWWGRDFAREIALNICGEARKRASATKAVTCASCARALD